MKGIILALFACNWVFGTVLSMSLKEQLIRKDLGVYCNNTDPIPVSCQAKTLVDKRCFVILDYTRQVCNATAKLQPDEIKQGTCPMKLLPVKSYQAEANEVESHLSDKIKCEQDCSGDGKEYCQIIANLLSLLGKMNMEKKILVPRILVKSSTQAPDNLENPQDIADPSASDLQHHEPPKNGNKIVKLPNSGQQQTEFQANVPDQRTSAHTLPTGSNTAAGNHADNNPKIPTLKKSNTAANFSNPEDSNQRKEAEGKQLDNVGQAPPPVSSRKEDIQKGRDAQGGGAHVDQNRGGEDDLAEGKQKGNQNEEVDAQEEGDADLDHGGEVAEAGGVATDQEAGGAAVDHNRGGEDQDAAAVKQGSDQNGGGEDLEPPQEQPDINFEPDDMDGEGMADPPNVGIGISPPKYSEGAEEKPAVKPKGTVLEDKSAEPVIAEVVSNGPFQESPDSHFFFYFLSFVSISAIGYVGFHNKNKILALVLEGRRGRQSRRRPNSAGYRKLDTSLEEAMMSHPSRGPAQHVIY